MTGLKFNPLAPISYASNQVKQGGLTVVCKDGRTAEGQQVLDLTMQARQESLEAFRAPGCIDAADPMTTATTGMQV